MEWLINFIYFIASFLESFFNPINCSIPLHIFLHCTPNLCCLKSSLSSSECFYFRNRGFSCIFGQFRLWLPRLVLLFCDQGWSSTKNNQVKQGISSQSISAMNWGNSYLSTCKQPWHNFLSPIFIVGNFGFIVSRNSSHVVMDSRNNWSWLFGDVDICKNFSSFSNTGKPFMEHCWIQMVQVKVNMIFFRTNSSSFNDLHGHSPAHNISRC